MTVDVLHMAPVLVAPRRGGGRPLTAFVPMRTPVSIRRISPDAFASRTVVRPAGREPHPELDGQIWRPVVGDLPVSRDPAHGRPATLQEALSALTGSGSGEVRADLGGFGLAPWYTRDTYARVQEPERVVAPEAVDASRLALDLRQEASAAVARRIANGLVHDGTRVWSAIPPAMMSWDGSIDTTIVHRTGMPHVPRGLSVIPEEIEDYIRHVANLRFAGRMAASESDRLRRAAGQLAESLAGLAPAPLADVAMFVRCQAIRTHAHMRHMAGNMRGDSKEEMTRHADALLPFATRAYADLIRQDDVEDVVARLRAAVGAAFAFSPNPSSQGLRALEATRCFAETVAAPRLARMPVPEADIESLGALSR